MFPCRIRSCSSLDLLLGCLRGSEMMRSALLGKVRNEPLAVLQNLASLLATQLVSASSTPCNEQDLTAAHAVLLQRVAPRSVNGNRHYRMGSGVNKTKTEAVQVNKPSR
ncbi:hypothetical protein Q9966_010664 [Columba livia]|nr:hypothetical protein Q9966_010664 [Columba livia]